MEEDYNPYFMDSVYQINKPLNYLAEFNASNDGYGTTSYYGKLEKNGTLKKSKIIENENTLLSSEQKKESAIGYNYGIYGNKTEGVPINYGIYGGIGSDNFNVGLNANNNGDINLSGGYVPFGLQGYYAYLRNQKPVYGLNFRKQYNF